MIEPVTYQKQFEGKSNAHLITFSDGRDYVVKHLQPGFEKALPNEWTAYCLARFLGLPIPFAQLVQIPPDFFHQVAEPTQFQYTKHHFASLYVPNCVNAHQVESPTDILNKDSLAGIILYDYWLCNQDRTRKNVLLREDIPNTYQLWIIDHAEIFGSYNWLLPQLETLPSGIIKSGTHELIAQFIEDERSFTEYLEIIRSIPTMLLKEIVALIPEDWPLTEEQRKGIVNILEKRRNKILPRLLHKFVKNVYRPLHDNC